jgi:hypothetical protein
MLFVLTLVRVFIDRIYDAPAVMHLNLYGRREAVTLLMYWLIKRANSLLTSTE